MIEGEHFWASNVDTVLTCPHCHSAYPADAPEGLCPACLFRYASLAGVSTDATDAAADESPNPAEFTRQRRRR